MSACSDGSTPGAAALRAAVTTHCVDCHDADARSGDVVLDPAALDDVPGHAETWEKVIRKLEARTMPPPDEPRPDEATYASLQSHLEARLDAHAEAQPNAGVLPRLHRLTRTEYENAVRDLLALDTLPAELALDVLLPADNAASGFDNIAELLYVSPAIMERYIDAANKLSRLAVGDPAAPLLVDRYRMPLQLPQDTHVDGLPLGTRGGIAIDTYLPLDGEYLVTVELAGAVREPTQLEVLVDGEPIASTVVESPTGPGFRRRPLPVESRVLARAGPARLGVTFVEPTAALDESTLRVRRRSRGTLPDIELVTVSGPYEAASRGDTPSRRRIFACRPSSADDELPCARAIMTRLARLAYRKTPTAADLDDLMPFYLAGRADGGFDLGIQRSIERLLISPQFLYRIELDPADAVPGQPFPIGPFELASRLSFFLWSSIPDDELLTLAEAGRLRDPGVLQSQVRRMLGDPRSDALVTNFAAQWLFLRDIESADPDLFLFRDYDESLRAAFIREAELFVDSIFRENRSVVDLLTADHTFVNERLAEHYGIPQVRGSAFRRVTLDADSPRRGLLGKGGILTATSYAIRTSPVLRGKYVLENLLASGPPPPPPDVPSLATEDASDGAPLSMREAFTRHRSDSACAACHAQMDAIGFALENFDAVGQWRDWQAGAEIDARSELPDGTVLDGVEGVRDYLTAEPERFVRAFTEKLLMYAIGRNVQYFDAPAVRRIVRAAAAENYALAAIVESLVESVPFQMRTATAPRAAAVAARED